MNDVNVNDMTFKKYGNKQKKFEKKNILLASWRSLTKRAGSGTGSTDPDPYQTVTDPEQGQYRKIG